MEVIHIVGPLPYETNTFMLCEGENALVIDPAADASVYLQQLHERELKLKYIIFTHAHFDHTEAAKQLKEETGAPIIFNAQDAPLYGDEPDEDLREGDIIYLNDGGQGIKVLHTPGHTKGSCCLLLGNLLFAGDTLFEGDIGRTDLEGGFYDEIMVSLKRLVSLGLDDETQVLPGHDSFTTLGKESKTNPYLLRL